MKYSFDKLIDRRNTGAIKLDDRMKYFQKEDVIPMWIADMDFATPPFVIEALRQRLEHPVLGYTLREEGFYNSVVYWLANRYNWNVDRQWIVYCPGVVPAISISILAFTQPGDKIIIQPPVYPPFFWCIENNRREIVENPLVFNDGYYQMDFADLEKKASAGAKMLVLCSPHNPVGRVWKDDELKEMVRICKKYNLVIISDEIHADLVFQPARHYALQTIAGDYEKIVTCIAPSKTFNLAGLSTSAVIIPDAKLRETFNRMIETIHVSVGNLFGFIALEAAYSKGEQWLDELLVYLKGNIDYVEEFILKEIPQIRFLKPEATYLFWLDCRPAGMTDKELTDLFVNKAGIGPSPGGIFGRQGEGFQRLNIAAPLSQVKKAMSQLAHAFKI